MSIRGRAYERIYKSVSVIVIKSDFKAPNGFGSKASNHLDQSTTPPFQKTKEENVTRVVRQQHGILFEPFCFILDQSHSMYLLP